MSRKWLFDLLANGDGLSATDVTALKLPALATACDDYVTAKYVPGPTQRVILTLTDCPVAVANTTGASFGSIQLLDFAQGRIRIEGGTVNLTADWSASADGDGEEITLTGSGDFSIGTTATADATLSSTDVDLVASTAMTDPFVDGVGAAQGVFVKDTEFDGTATAKKAYLNVIIDDADVGDTDNAIVYFNGTIILDVAFSGDL
jgi:hypothetical protein